MVRVCKNNFIFPCICCPSVCPLRCLLLNHWAEFNQTCYITFPHGKNVQEQHYFSICPSGICSSRYLLNHWVEFNQTCYIISPHGEGVGEQVCPSIMLLATLAMRVGILDGAPSTAHSSFQCLELWVCILLVVSQAVGLPSL